MAQEPTQTKSDGALPDLTEAQKRQISALSKDERTIQAPVWLAQKAYVQNDAIERAHAEQDHDGFWREKARLVDWMEPFQKVSEFAPPNHKWFTGGKLNASHNCIDRHVFSERRLKAALI